MVFPEAVVSDFEQRVQDALDSLPPELRCRLSNVEVVVEDEPPPGQPLLGLYQGVPLTRRTSSYSGALPDKITIYRGPLERLYGHDPTLLGRQIRRVVLHEVAHHFGISDERLIELDRY
ncbi:MAG: metallopeptidase family protein [Gaiellaceae bacterium]